MCFSGRRQRRDRASAASSAGGTPLNLADRERGYRDLARPSAAPAPAGAGARSAVTGGEIDLDGGRLPQHRQRELRRPPYRAGRPISPSPSNTGKHRLLRHHRRRPFPRHARQRRAPSASGGRVSRQHRPHDPQCQRPTNGVTLSGGGPRGGAEGAGAPTSVTVIGSLVAPRPASTYHSGRQPELHRAR